MAPIAALLLMNMPAEQSFWCLVAICDKYIPGYYSPGMEAIKVTSVQTSPCIAHHSLLFPARW